MENNVYYFEACFYFNNEVRFEKLEEIFSEKASCILPKKQTQVNKVIAKQIISFKTPLLDDVYTDIAFDKYIKKLSLKFNDIISFVTKNGGECVFYIVFNSCITKPCIGLSAETIKLCSELNASVYYDFN